MNGSLWNLIVYKNEILLSADETIPNWKYNI